MQQYENLREGVREREREKDLSFGWMEPQDILHDNVT